jgi:hypothetical protein
MQQKVDDFIEDLKRGDLRAFRYVTYDVLERAVLQIKDEALRYKTQIIENLRAKNALARNHTIGVPFMEYLMDPRFGKSPRANLVRCSLQGLFNLDPRVRLTAAHLLRKLRPDPSMQRVIKMSIGIDRDWISYDRRKRDFVFRPPQRMETVASRWEYYREKDLDWPTNINPGQGGLNDHVSVRSNDYDVTTELSTRWGETRPVRTDDGGWTKMTDEAKAEYMSNVRQDRVLNDNGEWVTRPRTDEIPYLPEQRYRKFHNQEGSDLLSYQNPMVGQYVPMGQGRKYTYVNCDGYRVVGNPFAETMKLDEFVTRIIWYNKIKKRQKNCLAIVSKDTCRTLWASIDGEMPEKIPLLSTATENSLLDYTDVPVLSNGLIRNKNMMNRWAYMRALKDIYEHDNCPPNVREDIDVTLWEAKRDINRISADHGLVLTKESIRVDQLNPAVEQQRMIEALQIDEKGLRKIESEDLGFRLPNTELRANGYRLLTDNINEEIDGKETKISLAELHENRVFAYRDENNDVIDYYRDKEKFFALKRQFKGNADREVVNVNLKRRSQALMNALIQGDGQIWKTATWPEVETAVIMTLYRVMLKYDNHDGDDAYITTFMDQVRVQDPDNNNEADFIGQFKDDSYSDAKRKNIMRASLGGLFNRDPRIRLTCIHFLRRIGPSSDMMEDVIRARAVMATESSIAESPETSDYRSAFIDTNVYERYGNSYTTTQMYIYTGIDERDSADPSDMYGPIQVPKEDYTIQKYEYQKGMYSKIERNQDGSPSFVKYFGQYQLKAPSEELDKLYKLCLRDKIVNQIHKGEAEAITRMTRAEFSVLSEFIDDEYVLWVPFASFYAEPFSSGKQKIKIQVIRGNRIEEAEIWSSTVGNPGHYAIFHSDDISVIKKGIDSTNFLVQKGTAEFLLRFYNFYPALAADVKKEIQDALYFYKQDDIVVEEIVLAFEGQNPDGRAVIKVGTRLAAEMNPGGLRVYKSLPIGIRKDIRDAIINEQEEFPEALINILGVIGRRAPSVDERDRLDYQSTVTGEREVVGRVPVYPEGTTYVNVQDPND